jgi:hypothetical protein
LKYEEKPRVVDAWPITKVEHFPGGDIMVTCDGGSVYKNPSWWPALPIPHEGDYCLVERQQWFSRDDFLERYKPVEKV